MTLILDPGSALACKVNAHRHGWSGSICRQAEDWSCGAKIDFRVDKCALGIPKCFHMQLFDPVGPVFVADMNGMDWLLEGADDRLDDQILMFWSTATSEPFGARQPERRVVVGAYRVRGAAQPDSNYSWTITPHRDGWVRFPMLEVDCPRTDHAGGRYVRSMERRHVERVFDAVAREVKEGGVRWHEPEDEARFLHFHQKLGEWLDVAATRRRKRMATTKPGQWFSLAPSGDMSSGHFVNTLAELKGRLLEEQAQRSEPVPPPQATAPPAVAAVEEAPVVEAPRQLLLGAVARQWVGEVYGEPCARALAVASITKPIVILRGATGVGKSHLARHLVPEDRFLLVPVGATWRGREDLLGYVNPVTGAFEPTEFTLFLQRAAAAWEQGDRSPWLVVFDEFNLSQPEHWLTDVLSLGQAQEDSQRRIYLGGKGFLPEGGTEPVRDVLLSRALHVVATINNDHTVLPLSPRVLDRSAIIELELTPRDALRRVGCTLDEDVLVAIMDLDDEMRGRGIGFSVRTASSLQSALQHGESLQLDTWVILDHVLAQEMLSKVRLHVGDPGDLELLGRMGAWQDRHGSRLPLCSGLLESWEECLKRGQDVVQA